MRRAWLVVASLGVCFTGVSSPRAAETELEVAGYEGSTTGGWSCGPQADVRYGGLAAKVRHSQRAATRDQGAGTTVVVGAAVEVTRAQIDMPAGLEQLEFVDNDYGDFTNVFGAADARVGYHFHYFGFETGVMLWSGWMDPREEAIGALPELLFSFGPRDFIYGELGFGVPTVTWLSRPAAPFATLGVKASDWLRLEFHAGSFRRGPALFEDFGFMFDSAWYVPINRRWELRGSLAFGTELTERQASLGFVYRL